MARQSQPELTSRRELFDYLEERMNASYHQLLGNRKLDKESTALKTYLLENTWNPLSLGTNEVSYLTSALSIPPSVSPKRRLTGTPRVMETDERGFYTITWPEAGNAPRLYLDTVSDPSRRFWVGYSLSDSTEIDSVLDKLANSQASFDRVWLWPHLLTETQALGDFRGVGIEYDYRRFDLQSKEADSQDYLSIQLWGGAETKEIIDAIATNPKFQRKLVISKVRMKYHDASDYARFVIEDLKYNGKLTTKGTSFSTHQYLTKRLRDTYASKITQIEKDHTNSDTSFSGSGFREPIFFDFSQNLIVDIDRFCEVVFSGYQPFRLWGVPEPTRHGQLGRSVSAVDLHTGSRLYFEVYSDVVLMGLLEGACGNTVARFFTNIQQTFSQLVTAQDGNGYNIF